MSTTKLKNETIKKENKKFNGHNSFGEMFVEDAKKRIEKEKREGILYFEDSPLGFKKLNMDL